MGNGGGGRKRQRRQREVALAASIGDAAAAKAAQERALGTEVKPGVPDAKLFVLDRAPASKAELHARSAAETRRARKDRRRGGVAKVRKSEQGATALRASFVRDVPGMVKGKKKKGGVAVGDMMLLEKRSFVSNAERKKRAEVEKEAEKMDEDVWETGRAAAVRDGMSKMRKAVVEKAHKEVRGAKHVLAPDNGDSINPLLEAHQDALGEAVATEVAKADAEKWEAQKMKFDPSILLERDIRVDTGDSGDDEDEEQVASMNDGDDVHVSVVQERKTRRDRNRASRRRGHEQMRMRKAFHADIAEQIGNLDEIAVKAEEELRRLDGVNAAELKRQQEEARMADGAEAIAAEPVHRKLGGELVPTEKDVAAVPLSEDLADNLRKVGMPKVNPLVKDRFLAFQRRGLIEPPPVIIKEKKQALKDRIREERRDTLIRKGRGSRSNMTYWRKARKR